MKLKVRDSILENKLQLVSAKIPSNDVSIIAAVNAGTVYETKETTGISHLVEHMLFRGTEKRPGKEQIFNEFDLLGGIWTCYTSDHYVALEARVTPYDFEKVLELTSDLLFCPLMIEEDISAERKIVLDELRNREDNPSVYLYDTLCEKMFDGCELGLVAEDQIKAVSSASTDKVRELHKELFNPANTTLIVAGPKNHREVKKRVQNSFARDVDIGENYWKDKINIPPNKERRTVIERELSNAHMMLGRIGPSLKEENLFPLSIATSMLSKSVFNKVRIEKGLSYVVQTGLRPGIFASSVLNYATCDNSKYDLVKQELLNEFSRYGEGNVEERYFEDMMSSIKKSFILGSATTQQYAKAVLSYWESGRIDKINSAMKTLEKITLDDVKEAARKYISGDDLTEVAIGKINHH